MSRVPKNAKTGGMGGWVFESHLKIVAPNLVKCLADDGPEMTCDWKLNKPPAVVFDVYHISRGQMARWV